ncbi:hypothetical protein Leryth_013398 [Lithospermum erythrorhizon]|nr:hypothetical protein Leryth_013398 [Lithospermum erythrorhizon]
MLLSWIMNLCIASRRTLSICPKAPSYFGEIVGKLVLTGALDFKAVKVILEKVTDDYIQKAIFYAVTTTVSSNPSGAGLLDSQAPDFTACKSLFPE